MTSGSRGLDLLLLLTFDRPDYRVELPEEQTGPKSGCGSSAAVASQCKDVKQVHRCGAKDRLL